MKLQIRVIAAAAASLATVSSFAAPAVDPTSAATTKIYLAGATALRNSIAGLVVNDICGGQAANNTTTLYNVWEDTAKGTWQFTSANAWAISCKITAAGAALINDANVAAGEPVIFYKSDAGGSAQGVFPIYNSTARPFINVANLTTCTNSSTRSSSDLTPYPSVTDRNYSGCTVTSSVVPNLGISDVEPGMFTGVNVPNDPLDATSQKGISLPSDGLTPAQVSELTVTPVVQTVFAVAVNTNLYNDMFAYQGLATAKDSADVTCTTSSIDPLCIPSIGKAEARTYFTGGALDWNLLVGVSASKRYSQINVCRRVQGSGTQAAANLMFTDFPCGSSALAPATWDSSSNGTGLAKAVSALKNTTADGVKMNPYLVANMGGNALASGLPAGPMPSGSANNPKLFVFEGAGTGDVTNCLAAANGAGGYAIGHVSKENAITADWKHVKLEGSYPDGTLAKQGRYDYLVESTVQYKTTAYNAAPAKVKGMINAFVTQMALPNSLAKLSAAAQNGVLVLPGAYAGDFGTGTTNEIKFGSRVTRAGNSCTPLTAAK